MSGIIVIVGSLNMDLVVRAPRHPLPGETLIGSSFQTFPGGKGANQAVAAARLGAQVRMIGRVGQDAFGDALLATVQRDGVDTTFIRRDPQAPTGVALITLDAAGQNTIVVASGANGNVSAEDVLQSVPAFEGADVLLVQLECPLDAVQTAIQQAHQAGMKVVLNPAPACPLPPDLLRQVDYLIPNQHELTLLAGGIADREQAIRTIQALGVPNVVVTLGDEGALLALGEDRLFLPAYRVEVVDTVAAGDAFAGAFALALAEGKSPMEAARWGNAAGAIAVTRPGAQPSMPTRQELEKFLKERNSR